MQKGQNSGREPSLGEQLQNGFFGRGIKGMVQVQKEAAVCLLVLRKVMKQL
jgi:hypothetical protein